MWQYFVRVSTYSYLWSIFIYSWTWLIKVIIFHDLLFFLPLSAYIYFITKLDEHNKKYQELLAKTTSSESLYVTKTTEISDKTSAVSLTVSYLFSYFINHPASVSRVFQTLNESFMEYHRRKHQHIRGINRFKPILDNIVEVKETVEEFLVALSYPPPTHSFLMKHRRMHIRKRDQFHFIPILGTIQEVSNDYFAMETGV
ncbi:hypothetical protein NPIL_345111 [Nephila pilipes]|uniref:Uncharacterized protein n=1 Tax=Nephila pilipes TaxID=299642 RepID=A0A8X6TFK0_NEPPI|nr:hypothetical protein NPIL_345111 [Nephila pilipes]